MKVLKQKILLLAKVGCVILITATIIAACGDGDCGPLAPPKWELPQPIDTLLLGSWKAIEGDNFDSLYMSQIIIFYENNIFSVRTEIYTWEEVYESEYRWSVNSDTLVQPDFYEYRSGRFNDYTYSLSADENLLYINLINYPWICKKCTMEGITTSLGVSKRTFKKLEEKE